MTFPHVALPALAFCLSASLASAAPVLFPAGSDDGDLGIYTDFGVSASDPDWSGTTLASGTAAAGVNRDGFVDGVGVVSDLYSVSAFLNTDVIETTTGDLVFSYTVEAFDNSGAGFNGVSGYSISGFAGYDVTFAYIDDGTTPYAPRVTRSADGDTFTFDFPDPGDILIGGFETFLFKVDAPGFATDGAATADIAIDTFGTFTEPLFGFVGVPSDIPPVPLPASVLGLLAALASLGGVRLRRSFAT